MQRNANKGVGRGGQYFGQAIKSIVQFIYKGVRLALEHAPSDGTHCTKVHDKVQVSIRRPRQEPKIQSATAAPETSLALCGVVDALGTFMGLRYQCVVNTAGDKTCDLQNKAASKKQRSSIRLS